MGRVFRYSEIIAGQVPTDQDFVDGKHDIIQTIESSDDIIGAILIGSIIHGTSNIRSDIDLALYYRDTPDTQQLMRNLRARSIARNLDLSLIPIEVEIAQTRFHTINWWFLSHLKLMAAQGGLIKYDFTDDLVDCGLGREESIISYLSYKWAYFTKRINKLGFMDYEDTKLVETLQKGLELGPHIARKFLGVWGIEGESDSKAGVATAYAQVVPAALSQQIEELMELDRWYSQRLAEQLATPNQYAYNQTLQHLIASMPKVYQFLKDNIMLLQQDYAVLRPDLATTPGEVTVVPTQPTLSW